MYNKKTLKFNLTIYKLCFLFLIILLNSCTKGFLEEVPDKSLLIPNKLEDFQAILDNSAIMNISPALGEVGADDFFIPSSVLPSLSTPTERNLYQWLASPYEGQTVTDWNISYQQVFYANVVLDGLVNINPQEVGEQKYDGIKGSALFYRSLAFYNIAKLFCDHFVFESQDQRSGIPIRLSSDVNLIPTKSTLEATYNRILKDLLEAEKLLPIIVNFKTRPSKIAVKALLARIYLDIEAYEDAERYANEALEIKNTLIDFNTLSPTSPSPFPNPIIIGNEEVIFYSDLLPYSFIFNAYVDSTLYDSYETSDLRKALFFEDRGIGRMLKGSYGGRWDWFSGLAVNELFLIKAECYARLGKLDKALEELNSLLKNRWDSESFIPINIGDQAELLSTILMERRKELVARGIRWQDLKRLNKDERFARVLTRNISEAIITLMPNSSQYRLPFPDNEHSY